jgi:3-deoxy-7-phosphoheptulonate synthase
VHPRPVEAFSDGAQSLKPARFAELMDGIRPFVGLAGKTM